MEELFPLFDKLTQKKISPKGMYLFWISMGAYCEASRHMGTLVSSLAELGHMDASERIKEIEQSEKHHGITLALAATCSIKAAGGEEEGRVLEQDRKRAERLFSSQEEVTDPLEKSALLVVEPCVKLFHERARCSTKDAFYFLGVTYGVERLANTNIIPGEINAFVRSGLYPLQLEQPEMGYLREHAEECEGAEGWHEAYMKDIIDEIGDTSAQRGVLDIERTTSEWYQGLHELITSV